MSECRDSSSAAPQPANAGGFRKAQSRMMPAAHARPSRRSLRALIKLGLSSAPASGPAQRRRVDGAVA
jgi:hypothetical protein